MYIHMYSDRLLLANEEGGEVRDELLLTNITSVARVVAEAGKAHINSIASRHSNSFQNVCV